MEFKMCNNLFAIYSELEGILSNVSSEQSDSYTQVSYMGRLWSIKIVFEAPTSPFVCPWNIFLSPQLSSLRMYILSLERALSQRISEINYLCPIPPKKFYSIFMPFQST